VRSGPHQSESQRRSTRERAVFEGGFAYLQGAQLKGAHLEGAYLGFAHLEKAELDGAHLQGAHLEGAQLDNAHLEGADLEGAELYRAYLKQVSLDWANVAGADFNLLPDSLPDVLSLYTVQNLNLVKFSDLPAGLVKLRSALKDLGLRSQENQLTCAIRRSELKRKYNGVERSRRNEFVHDKFERGVNYVFFDLTCQYGISPGRPLIIVLVAALLFSVVYGLAQMYPHRRSGIWVVWDEHRIDRQQGTAHPKRAIGFPSCVKRSFRRRLLSIAMLATYFSLLSALRIGWSGLNFGTWITRMQLREYSLQATGWVRLVSGLQSLISVYLVAVAILTYFGTPFEY
jgi:Pentapeptide repeats (8 copies)